MKKALVLLLSIFTISCSLVAQNAATPSVDSVKTDIIETDSTVVIKSTQITSIAITSQRIAQELERYKYEETQLNDKLNQVRKQIKEFERLMGGVIVTEKRIADKIEKKAKDDEAKKAKDNTTKPDEPDPKKKTNTTILPTTQKKN
jgi:hypothetical protein